MKAAVSLRRRRLPARVPAERRVLDRFRLRLLLSLLGPILMLLAPALSLPEERAPINVMTVEGVIDPSVAGYMDRVITLSEEGGAAAVLIEMDTPGGLLASTHDIVRRMMNSRVPIVVYISPSGSRAGSAGTFITAAAHVAAMAPGTNIGAAHPVDGATGKGVAEKITNDAAASIRTVAEKRGRKAEWYVLAVRKSLSVTETQALEKNVVDLIAADRGELLRKLDGRIVMGRKLFSRNAPVRPIPMDARERLLHTITHPNIAYILMIIAIYGIIAELQNPGLILPGVTGVTALLLALYSMAVLPINTLGLLLILFGIGLMIADIKVPSHGILTTTGMVAFAFGSFMLVRSPEPFLQVSTRLILATTIATALFFAAVIGAGLRAQRLRVATGFEGLMGRPVLVKTVLAPDGKVLAEGEIWDAENVGDDPLQPGDRAVVVGVDGFTLKVRKEN